VRACKKSQHAYKKEHQRRNSRRSEQTKSHSSRRVFAIGTWRNLYGTGMRPPMELLCKRGLRVTGKKKPS
jgi:hypothetical protein